MPAQPERIGRAVVISEEQSDGYTIKQLSPEMVNGPIEVGSEEARTVISSMKMFLSDKGKKKAYTIKPEFSTKNYES